MTVRCSIERRRSLVVLMEGGDLRRRDVGLPTWNICETGGTRLRGVRSELLGVTWVLRLVVLMRLLSSV